ncbi:uncharacterized protein N7483_005966 [Penicillium malachiteum]|uniref:uncharacterized protein n=1 Tax=Penicillium malachiteum TaxID=1324776 RepID=UPI0025481EAE|nr:uncharacterized protein N7483_005966 [Penicillium malachiteum]KAJ5731458.1 hypothetical protein N7483_005966 [Penicillium malachiteum]
MATLPTPSSNQRVSVPSGPVNVDLLFYHPPTGGSRPFTYVGTPPPGEPKKNFQELPNKVDLIDIRNQDYTSFTLDRDAFQVLQHFDTAAKYETYNSDDEVKRLIFPEVDKLILKNVPGAREVIIFDYTVRRQNEDAPRKPLYRAHVDQSAKAAAERVLLHVPDESKAKAIVNGDCRYRIINVWRPINGIVESNPLAFAAVDSVEEEDLVPVEFRSSTRTGEIMLMRPNPNQKWMYLSGVQESEILLLKCFDSESQDQGAGIASRLPHTAFWDPRTPEGAKKRESIEVRALVLG